MLRVVHDEDAPDVELQAAALMPVPQVERRARRDVEELGVLLPALDAVVGPRERRVEVVGDVPVELLVLLVGDLALRPRPERARLVDRLLEAGRDRRLLLLRPLELLHHDRDRDVIGVLAERRLEACVGEELVFALAEMQHDVGAAAHLLHRLDRVLAGAVGLPAHRLAGGPPGAPRQERDPVGDDERRVEADAELADEARVLRLVAGQRGEEFARARLRDRPDVGDHLVARHADAVVRHGDRPGLLVERDADLELAVALVERRIRDRLEAELVGGVRGVGHQLAEEHLLVAVQRVHHEVQELLHLGLEAERLLGGRGHGSGVRGPESGR